jgi:hypothetical protein
VLKDPDPAVFHKSFFGSDTTARCLPEKARRPYGLARFLLADLSLTPVISNTSLGERMKTATYLLTLILGALICAHFTAAVAIAQTTTATIEGTITDAKGGVVAGSQVTARSTASGVERSTTSDENGFFRITALPAATYSLSVSTSGFAPRTFDNVELTVNRTVTLDVILEVGTLQGRSMSPRTRSCCLIQPPHQPGPQSRRDRFWTCRSTVVNYLDLMQLVPGVAINRQSTGDNANPVLGERAE